MIRAIYLIRHGETEWNRAGRMQGHRDSPLTDRGERQAIAIGSWLHDAIGNRDGAAIVASPLARARRTAEIVGRRLGVPADRFIFDDRLKEITWGEWDGLTLSEIRARDEERWRWRLDDRWNVAPPKGESYAMLVRRVAAFLETATSADPLIVVTHGATGRVLRGLYAGLASDQILALDEPQDAIFRLCDGTVARIEIDIVDAREIDR